MTKNELRTLLLNTLEPYSTEEGYKISKSKFDFIKKTKYGWNKFQLIFPSRFDSWEINLGVLFRNNSLENIYHKSSFFDKKYYKYTPTVGITVESLINDGQEHRFDLSSIIDLAECITWIIENFISVAIPFYERYSDIVNIEAAFNDKISDFNSEASLTSPEFKGSKGLILAKMVGSSDYDLLKQKYRSFYETFADGFYMPEYEGVVKSLEGH